MSGPTPLNLHHLRYFYAIARAGNMKRAASQLGVSQPALSKQIHALEESLGFLIFHRSAKGMEPTPEGRRIFAYCERIFGHLNDLEDAIEGLRSGSAGRVAIATVNSIGVHILPGYLARFRREYPKVRVRLATCPSAQVLQMLREHLVDVGLVAGRVDAEDITAFEFVRNPLRVVVGRAHPLASKAGGEPLSPAEFDGRPMVAFDAAAPTRQLTDRSVAALGIDAPVTAESSDIEVLKRLVEIGMGFAVLPSHCIAGELARGELIVLNVAGFDLTRNLCVIRRTHDPLSPAVGYFLEMFTRSDT